jgi:hypothetical protein
MKKDRCKQDYFALSILFVYFDIFGSRVLMVLNDKKQTFQRKYEPRQVKSEGL